MDPMDYTLSTFCLSFLFVHVFHDSPGTSKVAETEVPHGKSPKEQLLEVFFFHGISKGYTPSKTYSLVAPCKLLVDFLFGKGLCVGVSEMATACNNSWNMVGVLHAHDGHDAH